MTERKKEDEKKPARLAPFVEPQLFLAVEEANRRLKEIMKVTDPTTGLYKSIQRITEVSEMMLRRQDQLRKLYEPSESVRKYLERSGNWSSNSLEQRWISYPRYREPSSPNLREKSPAMSRHLNVH